VEKMPNKFIVTVAKGVDGKIDEFVTKANPEHSVYFASKVTGENSCFSFQNSPNVSKPVAVAAKDEANSNQRVIIAAQAVYNDKDSTTVVSSEVIHHDGNMVWKNAGEINSLTFTASHDLGTLQLSATEEFTFLYFNSSHVEGKLFFIKNRGLLENHNKRCWFPAYLPPNFQYKASLQPDGFLISASFREHPKAPVMRSFLDLTRVTVREESPCCAPYAWKPKNVKNAEEINLRVGNMNPQAKSNTKKEIIAHSNLNYFSYTINESNGDKECTPTQNADVEPGQEYAMKVPPRFVFQGTSCKTGLPYIFDEAKLENFIPYEDTYRLEMPKLVDLSNSSFPSSDKIFTLRQGDLAFMITTQGPICTFWRVDKNSNVTPFFGNEINEKTESSISNLHFAGNTIIDIMEHHAHKHECYVLFCKRDSSEYNTYTAVKITWGNNEKSKEIHQMKSIVIKRTNDEPYAFLQHHENPYFEKEKDDVCIGVFTNNFVCVTCTCAGDGNNVQRSVLCFCNQPYEQNKYVDRFNNCDSDDKPMPECTTSEPF
jgi:hypothetical protein